LKDGDGDIEMDEIEPPPPPNQDRDTQTLSPYALSTASSSNESQTQPGTNSDWQQDQNASATHELPPKQQLEVDISANSQAHTPDTAESGLWMTEECVKFVFDGTWAYNMLECRLCECVHSSLSLSLCSFLYFVSFPTPSVNHHQLIVDY
jgi:hypothetical protein